MTIIETRLTELDTIQLAHGKHDTPENGMCLLEAAAYIAGEPFTDHPECVCPVLAAFGRSWNDALDNDTRNRILKPFIPHLIGTRTTPAVQDARAFMAADWAVRTYTPVWLRAAGIEEEAAALEQLDALTSVELCQAAMPVIATAKKKAAAAGDAAWDAAGDVAGAAARAAARDVAGAAARAAAGDALAPHVALLQTSAANLYDRMINHTT
jgi:hypothetical protein